MKGGLILIDKYKLMQKVYGKDIVHVCGTCCNRQTNPDDTKHKICIAFGTSPMVDCTWGEDKRACGLYNRPFRGLRPVPSGRNIWAEGNNRGKRTAGIAF